MRTRDLTILIGGSALLGLAIVVVIVVKLLVPNVVELPQNQNAPLPNGNAGETNGNANETTTNATPVIAEEVTYLGKVFLKGYGTPSESFGIVTADAVEVGLGSYDSKKEQFRPYIGDQVTVTFTSICRSNVAGCCRTLFPYCGTVKSWKPVQE